MNVRFSAKELRARISEQELGALRHEGEIVERTIFPNGSEFRSSIRTQQRDESWELELAGSALNITVPLKELEKLAEEEFEKDGVEKAFPTPDGEKLSVVIQVDMLKRPA